MLAPSVGGTILRRTALATTLALAAGLPVAACGDDKAAKPGDPGATAPAPTTLVGIDPERWTCDLVAPAGVLESALGGKARLVDGAMSTPRGVPRPCSYLLGGAEAVGDAGATAPEAWVFDIDCRDGYRKRADALFAQYTQTSGDLVEQFNAAADAGTIHPVDGGPAIKAPEDAHEVKVGAKALDHHGQGLLFVDDDTPCYVRVVGPDADRRLALATMIAKNLVPATAPMSPRAATP